LFSQTFKLTGPTNTIESLNDIRVNGPFVALPTTLKVATFNLWMANSPLQDGDKTTPGFPFPVPVFLKNEQRLQLIADRLNNVIKPDICFFSEIDKNTDRSKLSNGSRVNQAEWLAKNTSLNYWIFDPYALDYQWGQVGNAILSRFPIDKVTFSSHTRWNQYS
jgi:hypothetical protein